MANGRNLERGKGDKSREPGQFVALPWSVLDSAVYKRLKHPARSLLLEIARQYCRDNNGRLLASRTYLVERGWKSNDVISRALRQLLDSKLIHQTVIGQWPNKASWYALAWYSLDKHKDYDEGVALTFRRGAYSDGEPLKRSSTNGAPLVPSDGTTKAKIAPSAGTASKSVTPSGGANCAILPHTPVPPDGHHLELPSAVAVAVAECTSPCHAHSPLVGNDATPGADVSSTAEDDANRHQPKEQAETLSEIF